MFHCLIKSLYNFIGTKDRKELCKISVTTCPKEDVLKKHQEVCLGIKLCAKKFPGKGSFTIKDFYQFLLFRFMYIPAFEHRREILSIKNIGKTTTNINETSSVSWGYSKISECEDLLKFS